jgi:hypothetical protein
VGQTIAGGAVTAGIRPAAGVLHMSILSFDLPAICYGEGLYRRVGRLCDFPAGLPSAMLDWALDQGTLPRMFVMSDGSPITHPGEPEVWPRSVA